MNFCYAKTVTSTLLHVAIVDDVMLLIIQRREKFILALAGHLIVDRKVNQCIGRVDTADIRDQLRECTVGESGTIALMFAVSSILRNSAYDKG